jgi:hypothetical protein
VSSSPDLQPGMTLHGKHGGPLKPHILQLKQQLFSADHQLQTTKRNRQTQQDYARAGSIFPTCVMRRGPSAEVCKRVSDAGQVLQLQQALLHSICMHSCGNHRLRQCEHNKTLHSVYQNSPLSTQQSPRPPSHCLAISHTWGQASPQPSYHACDQPAQSLCTGKVVSSGLDTAV